MERDIYPLDWATGGGMRFAFPPYAPDIRGRVSYRFIPVLKLHPKKAGA